MSFPFFIGLLDTTSTSTGAICCSIVISLPQINEVVSHSRYPVPSSYTNQTPDERNCSDSRLGMSVLFTALRGSWSGFPKQPLGQDDTVLCQGTWEVQTDTVSKWSMQCPQVARNSVWEADECDWPETDHLLGTIVVNLARVSFTPFIVLLVLRSFHVKAVILVRTTKISSICYSCKSRAL